ncbi:MAG: hypothetical protein JW822_10850 [Spirochaetales bacterium]|nr:hypothetical protein [Spirochaetales bacterium]
MAENDLLFLDFDGVICDSINETIASSWLAYYKYLVKKLPSSMPCDYKTRFMLFRPFIRSGEDYLVIQDILANNMELKNQKQFDDLLATIGKQVMQFYKDVFYRARTEILTTDKTLWLSFNPLYLHMHEAMAKGAACENVYILSTKKPEFIIQILQAHSLSFNPARIIYSGQEEKLGIIHGVLEQEKKGRAYFVDDQISHLVPNPYPHIKAFLAAWGYIEKAWLKQHDVEIIYPAQLIELMKHLR